MEEYDKKNINGIGTVACIVERISQKKKEHEEIERLIRLEKASHPMPTLQEIRFFLNQFKNGNINDEKYRHALVDIFRQQNLSL